MIALFERFKLAIKYRATGCPSPWRWAGTALRRDAALWSHHTTQTPLPPIRTAPPPMPACKPAKAELTGWQKFYAEHWGCRRCGYYNQTEDPACQICHAPPPTPVYLEDEGNTQRYPGAPLL